jgi:hypothetical protein
VEAGGMITTIILPNVYVDISFKDDVNVILLLVVSFMALSLSFWGVLSLSVNEEGGLGLAA